MIIIFFNGINLSGEPKLEVKKITPFREKKNKVKGKKIAFTNTHMMTALDKSFPSHHIIY